LARDLAFLQLDELVEDTGCVNSLIITEKGKNLQSELCYQAIDEEAIRQLKDIDPQQLLTIAMTLRLAEGVEGINAGKFVAEKDRKLLGLSLEDVNMSFDRIRKLLPN
jgi:hypothetical protein